MKHYISLHLSHLSHFKAIDIWPKTDENEQTECQAPLDILRQYKPGVKWGQLSLATQTAFSSKGSLWRVAQYGQFILPGSQSPWTPCQNGQHWATNIRSTLSASLYSHWTSKNWNYITLSDTLLLVYLSGLVLQFMCFYILSSLSEPLSLFYPWYPVIGF